MSDNFPSGLLRIEGQALSTDIASRQLSWEVRNAAPLDYYGESQLADGTGADFFGFMAAEPNGVTAVVGHVSGGNAATMGRLISGLRGSLQARLPVEPDIRRVVRDINKTIHATSDSMYATLFCAAIDAERRELRYVNAAHEPALLVRRGGERVCRLESTGALLGLTERAGYGMRTVPLEPGDVLSVLTEGVVEATNEEGRAFGTEGVLKILRGHRGARSSRLVACLLGAVRQFASSASRASDDRTAIVVRFWGALANPLLEDHAEQSVFAAA